MPESVVVAPESFNHYPNAEEHANVVVVGGPAVVIQNETATFVGEDAKAHKIGDGNFDVFAINSARLTFYGSGEKLPKERDNAPKKATPKRKPAAKKAAKPKTASKAK